MKEFYIKIQECDVQVNEEVYQAYFRQHWNEQYNCKKRLGKELSFEGLCENGFSIELNMTDAAKPMEEDVITKMMVEKLKQCLLQLSDDERFLISELYFKEKTIREVSVMLSIPKSTIQRQKDRILERLSVFLTCPNIKVGQTLSCLPI